MFECREVVRLRAGVGLESESEVFRVSLGFLGLGVSERLGEAETDLGGWSFVGVGIKI